MSNGIEDLGDLADQQTGTVGSLSPFAGEYVTDMLGRGQALSEMPFEPYTGPLVAGASDLQQKAFEGLGSLNIPTDEIGQFTPQDFTAEAAQGLMNPYIQAALQPQIDEARRQSEISRVADASRLTEAGAFGGGRQAIMDAERQRNLLQNLAAITSTGYRDAFDTARQQFNIQQDRDFKADEARTRFGLEALADQSGVGAIQRSIEQQGITADKLQFDEERMDPYKQVQFLQSLLQGLPIGTKEITYTQPTGIESFRQGAGNIMDILQQFGALRQAIPTG
tara:strand:+ start:1134 stop:1973 length:840 start_codon:yes stop_codon:yes gene_type:complete